MKNINKEEIMKEFIRATSMVVSKKGLQQLILKTSKKLGTTDKFQIVEYFWNQWTK
jgi:DNA polymerase II large subunit